ncbi:hypothetical protein HD554DRAFT_696885 [Boletus coccyginus]|nr:hypothetical protein HD554DRAFT_696885 [Boletus coccyginus]
MKLYQQQVQLVAKGNAEQGQQNMANAQGPLPNMHEQASVGLQPGAQRLSQSVGVNAMVGIAGESKMANESFVPESFAAELLKQPLTQDQILLVHAIMATGQINHLFQQRVPGITPQQIADWQRQEYHDLLEQVFKMSSDLDARLPVYFAISKDEVTLREYVLHFADSDEATAALEHFLITIHY